MRDTRNYKVLFGCLIVGLFVIHFSSPSFSDFKAAQKLMQKSDCMACHAKTQTLVGPSFKEIAAKYKPDAKTIEVLTKSIVDGSGGKWGEMMMPPHPALSKKVIRTMVVGILNFKEEASAQVEKVEESPVGATPRGTDEVAIARGRDYFQGKLRFQNRGPSCNSCHHVKNDSVIGGGILAKDLTTAFSRMGEAGVKSILGSPPFPVMELAYEGAPLTDDEVHDLVVFLQYADEQQSFQRPKDYGLGLFLSGTFGAAILFLLFSFLGARRKKYSVNKEIYDRQIKSQ